MAFNVNKFISHFDSHAGFARNSKFEVRIAIPAALIGAGSTEELSLQCEVAELPGYTLNTVESKIFGAPTYLAGTPAFGDITLTFVCAGDLWEKKFFDAWMDLIIPKSTYLVNYKQDYQTTITIHQFSDYVSGDSAASTGASSNPLTQTLIAPPTQTNQGDSPQTTLNQQGTEIFSCQLINAFPVTVNPLSLNWVGDDIHRLNVVFKYDKWLNISSKTPINLPPTQAVPGDNGTQRNVRGTFVQSQNLFDLSKVIKI